MANVACATAPMTCAPSTADALVETRHSARWLLTTGFRQLIRWKHNKQPDEAAVAKKRLAKQLRRMYKNDALQVQLSYDHRQALVRSRHVLLPQMERLKRRWHSNIRLINDTLADRLDHPTALDGERMLDALVDMIQLTLDNTSRLNTLAALEARQLGARFYLSTGSLPLDSSHTLLALSAPLLTTIDDLVACDAGAVESRIAVRATIECWKRLIEFLLTNLLFGYNSARLGCDSNSAAMQLTRLILKHRVV